MLKLAMMRIETGLSLTPTALAVIALACMGGGCDALSDSGGGLDIAWEVDAPMDVAGTISAPTTDGDRFYAVGRSIVAFDVGTGAVAWSQSPFVSFRPAGLAVHGGRVFAAEAVAAAVDAETGRLLWKVPLSESASLAYPGADDRAFYTVTTDNTAYALDAETGAVRWAVPLGTDWWDGTGSGVGRGVAAADGVVYVAGDRAYPPNGFHSDGVVVALDAATGRERWRYVNGDGAGPRATIGAPVVAGDLLLLADNKGGAFIALDRATGRERWRVTTGLEYGGPAQAPVVADGVAYGTAQDTFVYAIDLASGRVLWKAYPEDTSGGRNQAVCGSVVLTNHSTVVATDRASGRIVTRDGYRGDRAASRFAVAGRRAFFVGDRKAVALDCPA